MNFLFHISDHFSAILGSAILPISNPTFLHWVGYSLRNLLLQIPMSVVRWLFIGLFLILMAWVVQLPSTDTTPVDRRSQWYEDLRIWAWVALLIQIVIYALF